MNPRNWVDGTIIADWYFAFTIWQLIRTLTKSELPLIGLDLSIDVIASITTGPLHNILISSDKSRAKRILTFAYRILEHDPEVPLEEFLSAELIEHMKTPDSTFYFNQCMILGLKSVMIDFMPSAQEVPLESESYTNQLAIKFFEFLQDQPPNNPTIPYFGVIAYMQEYSQC